jgi:hypothetical protein
LKSWDYRRKIIIISRATIDLSRLFDAIKILPHPSSGGASSQKTKKGPCPCGKICELALRLHKLVLGHMHAAVSCNVA